MRDPRLRPVHTYPKRQFEVFAAPDFHFLVVTAQLEEVLFVHGEQTARHRRRPERLRDVPPSFVGRGARVPPEMQVPVERAPVHLETPNVRERLVADYVNDGTHDAFPVLGHPTDQAHQPSCRTQQQQQRQRVNQGAH